MSNIHPIFQDMFDKFLKPVWEYQPDCLVCTHPIDLTSDQYVRIATLESITQDEPKAYAHELCAAEAEDDHLRDKAWEETVDYYDTMRLNGDDYEDYI